METPEIDTQNLRLKKNHLISVLEGSFLRVRRQVCTPARLIPLPCIFLWVRRGVPGLDFIFPKFYYRRVPATVFYSTFTLYFLSERKQNRGLRRGFLHLHYGSFTSGYENLPTLTIIVNFHVVEKNIIGSWETTVNFVSYSYINS